MAKASYQKVMLVNEEETTKTKYLIRVPTKGQKASNKIRLRKYDPVLQRHCYFVQKRLPNPKAK